MFTLLPDECDFFFLLTELKEVQITLSNAFFDTNNVFFQLLGHENLSVGWTSSFGPFWMPVAC